MRKNSILNSIWFFFFYITIFSLNCVTYKPFTKSMINEYNLTSEDMKGIQYFISDEVILNREMVAHDKEVTGKHTLKKVKDKLIEEIIFKEKTPGVLISSNPDKLNVAFEQQGHLSFSENEGYFVLIYEKTGKIKTIEISNNDTYESFSREDIQTKKMVSDAVIKYQDIDYNIFFPTKVPKLLVDEKSLENIEKRKRTVEGMRLPKE